MNESGFLEQMIAEMRISPESSYLQLERICSSLQDIAAQDLIGDSTRQRENGIFYTNFHLAQLLIAQALETSNSPNGAFLEPCVGGGAFYFAFIEQSMQKKSGSYQDLKEILGRCYIADNDSLAIETLRKTAPAFFQSKFGYRIEIPTENIFLGNSLWSTEDNSIRDFRKIFNRPDGFDFVVTNPPYKLIKGNKRHAKNVSNELIDLISTIKTSKKFSYVAGVPNLYKFFVEAIACNWVSERGLIGLLIPRSLLGDSQSEALREHLLNEFKLGSIFTIPEGSDYFKGVGQAFSMFVAEKGSPTSQIVFAEVPALKQDQIAKSEPISLATIRKYSAGSAIHNVGIQGQNLLIHLEKFPTISSLPGVINLRGEFDMTLDTNFLSKAETELQLIQGQHLGHFRLQPSLKYVANEFLNRPKGKWVKKGRIACQQICNMNQVRRLKWAYVSEGKVLGNSCNFISIDFEGLWALPEEMIFYFLAILNSSLLNERFKLLSPNNHVSNGEIDSLPVGDLSAPEIQQIVELSQSLSMEFQSKIFEKLDNLVLKHFELKEADRYWEVNS